MAGQSKVDDILGNVKRFRILCVGRSGVGKSALINHVFRITGAAVSQYEVGKAEIEKEFSSDENEFLLLHDSEGFEPGDTKTFDVVSKFLTDRRDQNLPLKDQLHAVWLCTETPRAGGRVFETGDERLLQLARDKNTPLVVVFTKYDRLVRTKRAELREEAEDNGQKANPKDLFERSIKEAQDSLNTFVNSKTVKDAMNGLSYAQVSTQSGYDADVSKLVDFTSRVVLKKFEGNTAWIMWAIAQRASLQLKVDAWLTTCTADYGTTLASGGGSSQQQFLRELLAKVHNDIITFWNFMDEKNILRSEPFKNFIFLLVQDAEESRNQHQSGAHPVPSSSNLKAIDQISQDLNPITDSHSNSVPTFASTDFLEKLRSEVRVHEPRAQRLLITYAADLTAVLKALFDVRLESDLPERTSWLELKKAYKAYEAYEYPALDLRKRSRREIHEHICKTFPQDQEKLDEEHFREVFKDLVKGELPKGKCG